MSHTQSVLTVIDALPSLSAVSVEETYPCDDGGELSELLLLVTPEEGHEGPQLRLREHTLEGS